MDAYVLCIVPEHGSEVVLGGTVSNERLYERAESIRVSALLAPISIQQPVLQERRQSSLAIIKAIWVT